MAISVHVQMSPGCGHGRQTIALVQDVLGRLAPDARLEIIEVRTLEEAERLGFRGSPTVLVDGEDIEGRSHQAPLARTAADPALYTPRR